MTQEDAAGSVGAGEDQEITARFSRDELVRGWAEREAIQPRVVPMVRIGAKTDLGRVRENNEDKFEFYEPDDATLLATRGSLYVVADGMGGAAAGQIASELAIKNFLSAYYDNASDDIPTALQQAVAVANSYVYNVARAIQERSGMGTTITALVLAQDRAYVAQVGDSRAYLIREGQIRQVSQDHSWVAEQVRVGGLTAEEAELSPYRNIITRAIGTQEAVEPDIYTEEVRVGDTWVLCTDGLTGHVEDGEILRVVNGQAPSEAARQLVELANARGGRDNITVLIVAVRELHPVDAESVGEDPAEEAGSERPNRRGLRGFLGI
ncbi:MAG: Stp1/IreP family PP2C-type Ser/Thr phosphatase [Chthonomonadales bacterium]